MMHSPVWTPRDVERLLPAPIQPVRPRWLYRVGLIGVAGALVLLQTIYVGMIALAAYATCLYVSRLPDILHSTSINSLTFLLVLTPPAAGVIVTFFLLKPLLARSTPKREGFHLDPAAEPAVFAFVDRVCNVLGAPVPTRIELDLQVNASARLRRGWRSLHTRDLVLTIGLPLAAGLTVRQFAGVLAHEFGHFSQHAGMRLYFLIETVRRWFARVAFERDDWDARLDSARADSGWQIRAILSVAYATVHCSRLILRGLLYLANILSAWFSRQMEFDADSHEAALVGAGTFEETLGRIPVLHVAAQTMWETLNRSWKTRQVCDDFPLLVKSRDAEIDAEARKFILDSALAETTERWATHPSPRARIAHVAGAAGVFGSTDGSSDPPAQVLFADFHALCRDATLFHFKQSLGDRFASAKVVPAAEYLLQTSAGTRRTEALQSMFGPLAQPARWFRFPEGPLEGELRVVVSVVDETAEYWRVLEESLNRHAALEFLRAGGRVVAGAFHLSSGEPATVEAEARASRAALAAEIARLRERYATRGYLLHAVPDELRSAYAALSAEQDNLLELRYQWVALVMICNNAGKLPLAGAASAREALTNRVRKASTAIVDRLSTVLCPPLGADTPATSLSGQLLLGSTPDLAAAELAAHILDRADQLGADLLGEMCFVAGYGTPSES